MNLFLCLAKKYKKDKNFSVVINKEIKKNLINKKITNNLYLKDEEKDNLHKNTTFTYYFTPFNIIYFLNMQLTEEFKNEFFLLKESILETLTKMKIKYEETETNKIFKNYYLPNVETLTKDVNDKLWFFSTLLLKPQKTTLKKSLKEFDGCFNIRGVNKNINFELISNYMFIARPDKFFPINKHTKKIFLKYDNILYDTKKNNHLDIYLNNCLDVTNRMDRVLFYKYSIDYEHKILKDYDFNKILSFLNDKNLKIQKKDNDIKTIFN